MGTEGSAHFSSWLVQTPNRSATRHAAQSSGKGPELALGSGTNRIWSPLGYKDALKAMFDSAQCLTETINRLPQRLRASWSCWRCGAAPGVPGHCGEPSRISVSMRSLKAEASPVVVQSQGGRSAGPSSWSRVAECRLRTQNSKGGKQHSPGPRTFALTGPRDRGNRYLWRSCV